MVSNNLSCAFKKVTHHRSIRAFPLISDQCRLATERIRPRRVPLAEVRPGPFLEAAARPDLGGVRQQRRRIGRRGRRQDSSQGDKLPRYWG